MNPNLIDESVIVCAHYDHLGLGCPGGNPVNIGKIHYYADNNDSGISVLLEVQVLLGTTLKPQQTIIFIAFASQSYKRG
ncbi:MAG: M28 family peptidase [Candidatus Pacebacteria bacterium]|nr:M28 family peptidase [Candidatus Paceibacterota bacterium]